VSRSHAELGQILLDRARVELWQLRPDERGPKRDAARLKARELITEARTVFQKAHDQSKAEYDRFPKTPLQDDPRARDERKRVEADYLRTLLNLAACTYEEGVSYEPKSSERR